VKKKGFCLKKGCEYFRGAWAGTAGFCNKFQTDGAGAVLEECYQRNYTIQRPVKFYKHRLCDMKNKGATK